MFEPGGSRRVPLALYAWSHWLVPLDAVPPLAAALPRSTSDPPEVILDLFGVEVACYQLLAAWSPYLHAHKYIALILNMPTQAHYS